MALACLRATEPVAPLRLRGICKFGAQGGGDGGLDKKLDLAAESPDFLDDARRNVGEFFAGHEKDSFEMGLEFAVHEGKLKFKLEVGDRTQTADEGDGFLLARKIHQQTVKR